MSRARSGRPSPTPSKTTPPVMTVTSSEAQSRMGVLIEHVMRGGTVAITRYKRVVARLVPPDDEI